MKDELIAQHQAEMKPEYQDMERRQLQEQEELTAEQEDYMLESALEDERIARGEHIETPTTFEMTIQKLRERRDKEGWTSTRYFDEWDKVAKIELEEYKEELKMSYGVN